MNKEMVKMTNEEMFSALILRMDTMESGLTNRMDHLENSVNTRMDKMDSRMDKMDSRMDRLETRIDKIDSRMDKLESRMDHLESDMDMEFKAVRVEMDVVYKSLNDKLDRLLVTKDVDGYEKLKIQVDVLTQGYQALRDKIG